MWKLIAEYNADPLSCLAPNAIDIWVMHNCGFIFDNLFRMEIQVAYSKYFKIEIEYEGDKYKAVRIYRSTKI